MTQDTVVVTAEDRREATALWEFFKAQGPLIDTPEKGKAIGQEFLLAFARHRIAAEQRGFKLCQDAAVKVAEERYAGHGEEFGTTRAWAYERAGKSIAAVLRTLSIKETGNGE